MKKHNWLLTVFCLILCTFIIQSCDKDDDELVASDSTFASFESWTLSAIETGDTPNTDLAGAHSGTNPDAIRKIYSKGGEALSDGEYPIGTVIVKHTFNPEDSSNVYHGMVKRGNDFDTDKGDWEYFVLDADGKISERGDSSFKACGGCHGKAASTDYLFTN